MANSNVPSGLFLERLDGNTVTVAWSAQIRRGYRYNVYAAIEGTATPLPGPPVAPNIQQLRASFSIGDVAGNSPPDNDLIVTVTSINEADGSESNQSTAISINTHSGSTYNSPNQVLAGRDQNGEPTFLATNEDGVLAIVTSSTLPANAATETKQDSQITELQTLVTQTSDVATETTLATLATEATVATLGTEATLATLATEATVATLGTEATLATLATEATAATLATEATLTTVAGDTTSLDAKVPSQGQALMATSLPVAIASDQSEVPVGDLLTSANAPQAIPVTNTNVALPATPLTGRKMIAFLNTGNTDVLLGIGGSNAFPLSPGQPLSIGASAAVLFSAIRPVGSGNVVIWEFA